MSYTALAVAGVSLAVLADLALLRTRLVARRAFWVSYAILFGFQVLVDGVLTGRGIVRYNPDRIVGWHLASAPLEDYLFGFAVILQTLGWWVWWGRREAKERGRIAGMACGPPQARSGAWPVRAGRKDVRPAGAEAGRDRVGEAKPLG